MMSIFLSYIIDNIKITGALLKDYLRTIIYDNGLRYDRNKKYLFVLFAADYYNLGDIAITKAQISFINTHKPNEYEVVSIPNDETYCYLRALKKLNNENIIITLIGGGNTGNEYEFIERKRRLLLKLFKHNKIISFPQSVLFSNDIHGNIYKMRFISLCKQCSNLTLCARETISYRIYCSMFENTDVKLLLVPDIVFSFKDIMNPSINKTPDNNVLVVFRDDKEKKINDSNRDIIMDTLNSIFDQVDYADTCSNDTTEDLYEKLEDFLNNLKKYRMVITDRLHAMIFCYLLSIPCIALGNGNKKIESTYETWLSGCDYIKFLDEINIMRLRETICDLLNQNHNSDFDSITSFFNELVTCILGNVTRDSSS